MKSKKLQRVDFIFDCAGCEPIEVVKKALKMSREEVVSSIIESGLKGRGGAGFPTGMKWKFAKDEVADTKYVICNADEGEPGTFKDREILDVVPNKVLSGMAICAYAIGSKEGIIYLRGEYNFLLPKLNGQIDEFNNNLSKIGLDFAVSIRSGSGAYICGEETALFESMEGRRGEPRNKPPFPTKSGYNGKPTVINNVETLVYTAMIINMGVEEFKAVGTMDSRGSKVFSVSGDTPKAGIHELELGLNVADFVEEFGDGDTKAVQVGGASGHCVPRKLFKETIIGFEGIPTGGSMMIFNSTRSMFNVLNDYLEFFAEESCGQCTPCRIGTQQLIKGVEQVKRGEMQSEYLDQLIKLTETMKIASKCGLGQSVANSFSSIVTNFREEMIY